MTVCIAAICDGNTEAPKIVFCSDRLQSSTIKFEHQPKVGAMGNSSVVLYSGITTYCNAILANLKRKLEEKFYSVSEISVLLGESCKAYFKVVAEENILNSAGLTFDGFYEKMTSFPEWFSKDIVDKIRKLEETGFDVAFIVAGIDANGADMYEVTGDGVISPRKFFGFSIIGEGYPLCLPEITKEKYSFTASLGEVFFRLFNAKKISERIGSVGEETDIGILYKAKDEKGEFVQAQLIEDVAFLNYMDSVIKNLRTAEAGYVKKVSEELNKVFYQPQVNSAEQKS